MWLVRALTPVFPARPCCVEHKASPSWSLRPTAVTIQSLVEKLPGSGSSGTGFGATSGGSSPMGLTVCIWASWEAVLGAGSHRDVQLALVHASQ